MSLKKYLAYASLGAILLSTDTTQADTSDNIPEGARTELNVTTQAPSTQQKVWYNKLSKETNFKTFPKELKKKIEDNLGGATLLTEYSQWRKKSTSYDNLVAFPYEEGSAIVLNLSGNEPRVFVFKTKIFEKDYAPTYPRSPKAIAIEKDAAKYGTLKWLDMPAEVNDLPKNQADKIKLLYKLVDDNFHYIYTAPFTILDEKKIQKGALTGKVTHVVKIDQLSSQYFKDQEEYKVSQILARIGRPLTKENAMKLSNHDVDWGARCRLYGSYSFGPNGKFGSCRILSFANWNLEKSDASILYSHVAKSEKKDRSEQFDQLLKYVKWYAKGNNIPLDTLELGADISALNAYQKTLIPLIHQLEKYIGIIKDSKVLEIEDGRVKKVLKGSLIDQISIKDPKKIKQHKKTAQFFKDSSRKDHSKNYA